jgi:hypothetical protein
MKLEDYGQKRDLAMLNTAELHQVRDYVLKILPELIRSEPDIATTIEGILAQQFPRRDEFARLLDELEQSRQENRTRFDEMDQRFEQVDQRFEQVDQRFGNIEARLDRSEQTQLAMRRGIAKLQSGQEWLTKRMDGFEVWMQVVTGTVRNEKGQSLEEIAAIGLSYGLRNPDIKPENIRLRQKLVDRAGLVYALPMETEVDIIAQNGRLIAFEVKSTGRGDEVTTFAFKVKLLALQNPDKEVQGIFVALAPTAEVRAQCERYGIELLEAARGLPPP